MLDQLTGALSKDLFMFLLSSETKRAVRYTYFISLLIIDLDRVEPDQNLALIARLIRQNGRSTDFWGRIDHQRFSVVLQHAERVQAYGVAERIREQVVNHRFMSGSRPGRHTVSIGGACLPTDAFNFGGLLEAAMESALAARSQGGDKVYFLGW